jgi:hypothetical protein
MQNRIFMCMMVTAALMLGAGITKARAFDLTGHWVGTWTCKGFDGTKFSDQNKTSTLDITQSGNAIHAAFEKLFLYAGAAVPDPAKPEKGEVVLADCHTNAVLEMEDGNSEIIRAPVATKPASVKATFKGLSILENDVVPFGQQVQTCKYSYKRIDTDDPAVGSCP